MDIYLACVPLDRNLPRRCRRGRQWRWPPAYKGVDLNEYESLDALFVVPNLHMTADRHNGMHLKRPHTQYLHTSLSPNTTMTMMGNMTSVKGLPFLPANCIVREQIVFSWMNVIRGIPWQRFCHVCPPTTAQRRHTLRTSWLSDSRGIPYTRWSYHTYLFAEVSDLAPQIRIDNSCSIFPPPAPVSIFYICALQYINKNVPFTKQKA